jgi:hypothetical protein
MISDTQKKVVKKDVNKVCKNNIPCMLNIHINIFMIERLKDLIAKNYTNKEVQKKNDILLKSRKEVEINGNGTSGYTIKEGSHKGTVLGHITRAKSVI